MDGVELYKTIKLNFIYKFFIIFLFQEEASCSYIERVGAILNSALALTGNKKDSVMWFEIFKTLGESSETGYNWEQISENLRRQETETTNTVRAPAGTVVQVQQLVGYCGHSTIRTEVFRTELKLSPTLESCVPTESVDRVLRCDASDDDVSFPQ